MDSLQRRVRNLSPVFFKKMLQLGFVMFSVLLKTVLTPA